jgi:hypothetical protein
MGAQLEGSALPVKRQTITVALPVPLGTIRKKILSILSIRVALPPFA